MSDLSVPLSQPLYGASFGQAVSRFFKKYGTFSGRASRSEYWWVYLFTFLIGIVVVGAVSAFVYSTGTPRTDGSIEYSSAGVAVTLVGVVIALALVIPQISLTVRRLHDANLSGGLWFLTLIPSVGSLIVFILMFLPSNALGSRFDK